MILHDAAQSLLSKRIGNVIPLLITQDDTPIVGIYRQIVMKETSILLHDIDRFTECRPCLAVEAVTVSSSDCVRSTLV
jgi:hypothetical protein